MILGLLTLSGCRFHAEKECLKIEPVRSAKGSLPTWHWLCSWCISVKRMTPLFPSVDLIQNRCGSFCWIQRSSFRKRFWYYGLAGRAFSKTRILNRKTPLWQPQSFLRTLLLLDLSGSVVQDADKLGYLKKSSIEFARQALIGQDGAPMN